MVKIKLLLGLGTTAVVGGAGTAVYFGIQSGTDKEEKKKSSEDSKPNGETPPSVPNPSSDSTTPVPPPA